MGANGDLNDPTSARGRPMDIVEPLPQGAADSFELPPVPSIPSGPDSIAEERLLRINEVRFSGNTVISTIELQNVAAPFLHRRVSSGELEDLRERLTLLYVNRGYINSGALIPDQSVGDGVLRIDIVEGRLTDVQQEGQERLREAYLRDRLLDRVDQPLNVKNLQDEYLILLQDPLIDRLNGRLLPGRALGEAVLDLAVTRRRPYGLMMAVDNYAPPQVGGVTGRISGQVTNLSSFGERFDFNVALNQGVIDQQGAGYDLGVDVPVSSYDTRVGFRYADTLTSLVEDPFASLDITTQVRAYEGYVSQPVYRTPATNLTLAAIFNVRQQETFLNGIPFSFIEGIDDGKAQVTVLRLQQEFSHRAPKQVIALRSMFNVGLNCLGSTVQQNGNLPDSEFFSWFGQVFYAYQFWDGGLRAEFRSGLQMSNKTLLPVERFAVGGVTTVRGYRTNYLVRDEGFYVGLDLPYPIVGGDGGSDHNLYLVPFSDYGGAWYYGQEAAYIQSIGLGLRYNYQQAYAELYWGHAFSQPLPNFGAGSSAGRDIQDDGFLFQVRYDVF